MRKSIIAASLMVVAAGFAPSVLAQGQGKGKNKNETAIPYGISLAVIADANGNGLPNAGDSVRFNVSSATATPFVSLTCYQGTSLVYAAGGYPVDFVFMLRSGAWTSGAADCTATAYTTVDGTKTTTVGTLSFEVGA